MARWDALLEWGISLLTIAPPDNENWQRGHERQIGDRNVRTTGFVPLRRAREGAPAPIVMGHQLPPMTENVINFII